MHEFEIERQRPANVHPHELPPSTCEPTPARFEYRGSSMVEFEAGDIVEIAH
jgi:hypothetical protein